VETNLILHVPHASRVIPDEVRDSMLLSYDELKHEQDRLVDHYTDELFDVPFPTVARCIAPVSRFAVDVERFDDDDQEPLAEAGMGVIYTRTTTGMPLRTAPTSTQREHLLATYYRPHHARLEMLVEAALAARNCAVIVDCHSFPSTPLACDLDQGAERPDICLGTDECHTPESLVDDLRLECAALGWTVDINRPYAGTVVPLSHYRKDSRVTSVMIEVNRRLYLRDEPRDTSHDVTGWPATKSGIERLLATILAWRSRRTAVA
jgi:N-formylglutamate amidohydrolase